MDRDVANGARFAVGSTDGHYESWFSRANHPSRPLAWWQRYTVFSPAGRPREAIGELWAIYFDGERDRVIAVKEEHPIACCTFASKGLHVHIGHARLDARSLEGRAESGGAAIAWSLEYSSPAPPLLLLPPALYGATLPRAKALVGSPMARFDGHLEVDGERVAIDGWVGSQNHNWGSAHTDRYAWGQVAGFDDAPEVFVELATARVRVGPLLTPPTTLVVMREGPRELRLSSPLVSLRARGEHAPFVWTIESHDGPLSVRARIEGDARHFVALPYGNPPGGIKTCLNTKLARCELEVRDAAGTRRYTTKHRAAFELLGDEPPPPGVRTLGTPRRV